MKKKVVLILGSLSDIAKSIAHEFGKNGYNLLLAARKNDELIIQSEDLRIRYNIEVNFYMTLLDYSSLLYCSCHVLDLQ